MSVEQPVSAGAPVLSPTKKPEKRPFIGTAVPGAAVQPVIDQRYVAPIFITIILLVAHFSYGALKSPWHTGAAIVTSIVLEMVFGKWVTGKIPNLASAYVSGISVGILVRTEEIWPFVLTAALSILSKYVIRVKGRHIWNPSNFAIAAMLIVAHDHMATLGPEFDNQLPSFFAVAALGSIIVGRLHRLHISATFVVSFVFFAWIRSLINGHPFLTEVAPITGPMYMLFTFFMVTDPKTTVQGKYPQMLVVFLVAAVECILRLMENIHAPYFALFTVGPIANLIEIWWTGRSAAEQKRAPATA